LRIGVAVIGCHRRGGIERVALETVNLLASRGHQVELFTYDADQSVLDDRVVVKIIRKPIGPALWATVRFSVFAQRAMNKHEPYDVCCGFGSLSVPGSVVWVTSVHTRWMEVVRQGEVPMSWKRRLNPFHVLMMRQERRQYRPGFHRRLLAMGPAIVEDLERFCESDRDEVALLAHGYDDQSFNVERAMACRERTRASLGYRVEDRVVLCVANEIPRKGVPTLISAIALISDPNLKLLLLGRLDADRIKNLISQAGLDPTRVRVEPPQNDVAPFYAAADIFALPTLYDAWGLVIVEALACGCPVVTTSRAGAASLVLPEHVNGVVIENPADVVAMSEALKHWTSMPLDLDQRHIIASSVQSLNWDQVIVDYEEHLASVAKKKQAPGLSAGGST